MNNFTKAFSLIELMVVIAIVALLAAIAVPAYRDYMLRTKIGIALNHIYSTTDIINNYYATEGVWPVALSLSSDLGITYGDPDDISDFTSYVAFLDYVPTAAGAIVPTNCGRYSLQAGIAGLSQDTFTPPDDIGVFVNLSINVIATDDKFVELCSYDYFDQSVSTNPLAGDYVSDCVNSQDTAAVAALQAEFTSFTENGCI